MLILNIIFIILALFGGVCVSALMFWLLLRGKINFWQAFKYMGIAQALNKLLITSSGYAAISWKLKQEAVSLEETIVSFSAMEFFSFLPWIILGIGFGATVVFPYNGLLLFAILLLVIAMAALKRKKLFAVIHKSIYFIAAVKNRLLLLAVLALLNVAIGTLYYVALCGAFSFSISFFDMLKVVSVATSVGYLSPVSSGLGVKESGLIFLLMEKGVLLKKACFIALADRSIQIIFFAVLGLAFGGPIIMERVRAFFSPRAKKEGVTDEK